MLSFVTPSVLTPLNYWRTMQWERNYQQKLVVLDIIKNFWQIFAGFGPIITPWVFRAVKERRLQGQFYHFESSILLDHKDYTSHTTADICKRLRFRNHRSMSGPLGPRSSYSQSHCSSSMSPCQTTQQDRSSPTPQDTTTHTPKPHHLSVRMIEHAIYLPSKTLLEMQWTDQRSVQYLFKSNNLW